MTTVVTIPNGFRVHTENGAKLLLPEANQVFLNPVQEFNRDLSVAAIRVWSEQLNEIKRQKWENKQKMKTQKRDDVKHKRPKVENQIDNYEGQEHEDMEESEDKVTSREYQPHKCVILEPLSATGLRSIRYAQEIPLVRYVIANDISPGAIEVMKRNVAFNNLGPDETCQDNGHASLGKVRVNEGDACTLMYSHRLERQKVDVVDLDPYGTAAPFIDAAVQCVTDGGLLCVTCTDMSVLGNTNYPEKCFSNYGGVPVKAEYCHEVALRLVLNTLSTSAARYGRYIQPLLSLSIDFYVRLFVRVRSAPIEVKKAFSQTSFYYVCNDCQSYHCQTLGKIVDKSTGTSSNPNLQYRVNAGPPIPPLCNECGGTFHVAGPMWSGPIHDKEFTKRLLQHVEEHSSHYGTSARLKGMVTLAHEELDVPFYFTPQKIASFFHCTSPSLDEIASALLNAGYDVSRSHACAGSIKTTANRKFIHDVYREYIKSHPVKLENIKEGAPAATLLEKEASSSIDLKHNPNVSALSKVKLVRYQQNPTSHWGPGTKAGKRKRDDQ